MSVVYKSQPQSESSFRRKPESRVPGENRDPVFEMVPGFRRDDVWMPPYHVRGRLLKSGMTEKAVYGQTLINCDAPKRAFTTIARRFIARQRRDKRVVPSGRLRPENHVEKKADAGIGYFQFIFIRPCGTCIPVHVTGDKSPVYYRRSLSGFSYKVDSSLKL